MNFVSRILFASQIVLMLVVIGATTVAQDITDPKGDFGKDLPRVPALSPEASLKALEVAKGFHAELVAAEPLIHDPVAIDFDAQGRMYVVQLPPYNAYVVKDFDTPGSIALLEDRDEDGRYETATKFATDLKYPTAVACWDGGVFVGDAPDLLYLKDTDGDGKADVRRVALTGFGTDKAGEAHLNSIRWGLDNRFHFSTSLSGGDVEAPDHDGKALQVRNRGVIFDPRSGTFELTSGGGQHGMSMDDWGRKFVCSNSVPAQTLMYDDRYVTRNPRLKAPAPAVDIAPDKKYTQLFRITPPEPWRVLRTRLRKEGKFRGSDEGGKPFGFFTGATGVTIYRGDAWPASHRGNLLVGDVANNLVYRATLTVNGLGLVAERADPGAEFVASRDIWFRPVQLANAPDGTLLVLDMNRELIEGAAFLPPEFLKHLDAVSGSDRGRIYRIVPDGVSLRRAYPRLDKKSEAELVQLLDHANGWHRDTAARLLYERATKLTASQLRSVHAGLRQLAAHASTPQGRATALSILASWTASETEVLKTLSDETAEVRIVALRLAEPLLAESPLLRDKLVRMTDDPDARVRYQLAFSLGEFLNDASLTALSRLALSDGEDPWMQLAILSSLPTGGDRIFQRLADNAKWRHSAHGRRFLVALATQVAADKREAPLATVLQAISQLDTKQPLDKSLVDALVTALVADQPAARKQQIIAAAGGKAGEVLEGMLAAARNQSTDEELAIGVRADAIHRLRLGEFDKTRQLLTRLLRPTQPKEVQQAALLALSAFESDGVPDELLKAWPSLSPAIRAGAVEIILSRPAWIMKLLDAVEADTIARSEIGAARIQLLSKHPLPEVATRVQKLFGAGGIDNREQVVAKYQPAITMKGTVDRGKLVFKKNCSTCHRLDGVGTAVGAELQGIAQRGLPSILLNVLAPNREVKPKFLTYVVQTEDGRVLTGMIASESANSIVIRQADGKNVDIQRVDIARLRSTGLSYMPEGLEKEISVQAMADLLAYLGEH